MSRHDLGQAISSPPVHHPAVAGYLNPNSVSCSSNSASVNASHSLTPPRIPLRVLPWWRWKSSSLNSVVFRASKCELASTDLRCCQLIPRLYGLPNRRYFIEDFFQSHFPYVGIMSTMREGVWGFHSPETFAVSNLCFKFFSCSMFCEAFC